MLCFIANSYKTQHFLSVMYNIAFAVFNVFIYFELFY